MSTDSGGPLRAPRRNLWYLPDILAVEVRRRRYPDLRRVTVAGVDRYLREGTEVVVRFSKPLPIRALGPVLWIGDVALTIAESDDGTEYRFLAPNPEALRRGDPVSLGWNTPRAPRNKSRFRYEWPDRPRPVDPRGAPAGS
jgi:hypothetical protein